MKTKYYVNFVCSENLNSPDNIDYEFTIDRDYLPQKTMYLGGVFMVVEDSAYDVAKDEAKVFATCYYPKNRVSAVFEEVNVEEAQKVTYDLIAALSEKYHLKGSYTTRNKTAKRVKTDIEDVDL